MKQKSHLNKQNKHVESISALVKTHITKHTKSHSKKTKDCQYSVRPDTHYLWQAVFCSEWNRTIWGINVGIYFHHFHWYSFCCHRFVDWSVAPYSCLIHTHPHMKVRRVGVLYLEDPLKTNKLDWHVIYSVTHTHADIAVGGGWRVVKWNLYGVNGQISLLPSHLEIHLLASKIPFPACHPPVMIPVGSSVYLES